MGMMKAEVGKVTREAHGERCTERQMCKWSQREGSQASVLLYLPSFPQCVLPRTQYYIKINANTHIGGMTFIA